MLGPLARPAPVTRASLSSLTRPPNPAPSSCAPPLTPLPLAPTKPTQLLTPLFFASIGFSLPFLSLWTAPLVWRGLVYACLMALGQVLAGGVLLVVDALRGRGRGGGGAGAGESKGRRGEVGRSEAQARRGEVSTEAEKNATALRALERGEDDEGRDALSSSSAAAASSYWSEALPAAAFVGLALVARGEIGVRRFPSLAPSPLSSALTPSVPHPDPRPPARLLFLLSPAPAPVTHRPRPSPDRRALPDRHLGRRAVHPRRARRVRRAREAVRGRDQARDVGACGGGAGGGGGGVAGWGVGRGAGERGCGEGTGDAAVTLNGLTRAHTRSPALGRRSARGQRRERGRGRASCVCVSSSVQVGRLHPARLALLLLLVRW